MLLMVATWYVCTLLGMALSWRYEMRAYLLLTTLVCLSVLPAAPSSAAKVGETCDGIAAIKCDPKLWCEHPAGECNVPDGAGTCVEETGPICMENYLPVCACAE